MTTAVRRLGRDDSAAWDARSGEREDVPPALQASVKSKTSGTSMFRSDVRMADLGAVSRAIIAQHRGAEDIPPSSLTFLKPALRPG